MLQVVAHRQKDATTGLKITARQRTMSGLIGALSGQTFILPVMLLGHVGWSQIDATFTGLLSNRKVIAKLSKSYREVIATWQL